MFLLIQSLASAELFSLLSFIVAWQGNIGLITYCMKKAPLQHPLELSRFVLCQLGVSAGESLSGETVRSSLSTACTCMAVHQYESSDEPSGWSFWWTFCHTPCIGKASPLYEPSGGPLAHRAAGKSLCSDGSGMAVRQCGQFGVGGNVRDLRRFWHIRCTGRGGPSFAEEAVTRSPRDCAIHSIYRMSYPRCTLCLELRPTPRLISDSLGWNVHLFLWPQLPGLSTVPSSLEASWLRHCL